MLNENRTQINFNVKLTIEELKALSVFKHELNTILEEYYDRHDKYIDMIGKLMMVLRYLGEHNYEEHLSKIELLKNLICDYFFNNSAKDFISEFKITDNSNYCKFISKLHSIYRLCVDLIDEQDYTEKEIKDLFADYHNDLKKLINS